MAPLVALLIKAVLPIVAKKAVDEAVKLATPKQETQVEIVMKLVRHGLTTAGGGLVVAGMTTTSDLQAAIGALMTLVGFALSLWQNRKADSSQS